jgi:hypothetical protein
MIKKEYIRHYFCDNCKKEIPKTNIGKFIGIKLPEKREVDVESNYLIIQTSKKKRFIDFNNELFCNAECLKQWIDKLIVEIDEQKTKEINFKAI